MSSKIYFRLISIGTIKIIITIRIEKKSLDFEMSRGFGALTILESFGATLFSISEAPLIFKSLILENVSHTREEIQDKLAKNYIKQLGFQIYKIFGSSDLLGNPVGFVSKLGSGFVEFLSEPSKGLLKSPKEFGKGVYKGSKALATGIISASFSSASGIGGSIYGLLKSVSGQDIRYQRSPNTCWDGLYKGTIGGGKEIVEGVTGVVTKPYNGAKKGPAGFAKGVGKGICGLIVCPLTCSLKCCSTFSTGVSRHATAIRRGGLNIYGKFRFPRYINEQNILTPYDEDASKANNILFTIKNGRYAKEGMIYHAEFPRYKQNKKTGKTVTLIFTKSRILICSNYPSILYKAENKNIDRVEVYEGEKDENTKETKYLIYFMTQSNRNYMCETDKYSQAQMTYNIIQREIDS